MITPQKARQDYEAAMTALEDAIFDPTISSRQRQTARDGIREITNAFINQIVLEIQALTAQYLDFINTIGAIVAELQRSGSPLAAVQTLTGIVQQGAGLVNAATGAPRAPAGAKAFPPPKAAKATAAAGTALRILCVHGVGHQEGQADFEAQWHMAISEGLSRWSMSRPFTIKFLQYDDLFADAPLSAADVAVAAAKLGLSGLVHGIGDLFRQRRGFGDIRESLRWTAGMVAQWVGNEKLRAASRRRIVDIMRKDQFDPHVILAHSLGSLISYDAFARPEGRKLLDGRTLVTFGSQIGNPFVRSTLGGRIRPLETARHWYHLFNQHDDAFTAELRIPAHNFEQVDAHFDIKGILDHDARQYLTHPNVCDIVWHAIAQPSPLGRGISTDATESNAAMVKVAKLSRRPGIAKPPRRALLVGINDYPNPADRLQGCVNDVFLMSSMLQECGFEPENIRILLNERATAVGIVERLNWLLQGAEDGQDRVFFYSGHGAQIPGYGVGEKVDQKDECLVSYDFDWSREHAVTDDQFYELYSQLPYSTRFLSIFDCCHSGGLTREGGARVRGLTPPDDIRHRELRWDAEEQMWVQRNFQKVRPLVNERKKDQRMFGEDGAVKRLGRAASLRPSNSTFDKARRDYDHKGPFMPFIIQACGENQFSYEYRHGVQSYGAFTYSMGLMMREWRKNKKKRQLSWDQFVKAIELKLVRLKYDQKPCLVCPDALRNDPVPWGRK